MGYSCGTGSIPGWELSHATGMAERKERKEGRKEKRKEGRKEGKKGKKERKEVENFSKVIKLLNTRYKFW